MKYLAFRFVLMVLVGWVGWGGKLHWCNFFRVVIHDRVVILPIRVRGYTYSEYLLTHGAGFIVQGICLDVMAGRFV